MKELAEYDHELDPPTMTEFQLFLRLGNLLDAFDCPDQWPDDVLSTELVDCAELLEQLADKYDVLLGDYYKGQRTQ